MPGLDSDHVRYSFGQQATGRLRPDGQRRLTERGFMLVECMRPGGRCAIRPGCRLPGVFDEAMAAFFAVLDRCTLADLLIDPRLLPDPPASSG